MTLSLAIIINVALDCAILGFLAFFMSRAGKLTPHRGVAPAPVRPAAQAAHQRTVRRGERVAPRLHPALD
jgi:hypothetical protein